MLVPGVVNRQTNVVEHPELVAWRLCNFARLVGRENVIAESECGFCQGWHEVRVHPVDPVGQAPLPGRGGTAGE